MRTELSGIEPILLSTSGKVLSLLSQVPHWSSETVDFAAFDSASKSEILIQHMSPSLWYPQSKGATNRSMPKEPVNEPAFVSLEAIEHSMSEMIPVGSHQDVLRSDFAISLFFTCSHWSMDYLSAVFS